ncbi:MAG: hypothetical protein IJZ73_03965 [Clostridia bacterium]|nr:hypothetical protein [Clostridia bacterium]
MEEQLFEQTEFKAQAVPTEDNLGANESEVSLGKFKDAKALLSAYNSLQAEFTKRCQRVKELEGMMAKIDKVEKPVSEDKAREESNQPNLNETENIGKNSNGESSTPKPASIGEILNSIPSGTTDKLKEQVLKDYLKSVIEGKPQAIIMDGLGTGLKTLSKRPTTFQEAGNFAVELLKN